MTNALLLIMHLPGGAGAALAIQINELPPPGDGAEIQREPSAREFFEILAALQDGRFDHQSACCPPLQASHSSPLHTNTNPVSKP